MTSPNPSERSTFSPSGSFQLKECNNEANINMTIFSAKGRPAQILLPEPNGRLARALWEKQW
ncbi:hypothetical protein MTR67_037077 [Solanum verrucosum]|uniref:Uncharacterized protein n=1 Tax=Solanum verrucosum TaxID=315347 RepID=A0AAF0UCZ2_SOLVR|nr:hypothetical protein MTR67_037077 [Solanum verrucosum]